MTLPRWSASVSRRRLVGSVFARGRALVLELPTRANLPTTIDGFARFRCPDHPLFDAMLPAAAELGPILVADTGTSTADAAIRQLGEGVGLAVNAGERRDRLARRPWCKPTRRVGGSRGPARWSKTKSNGWRRGSYCLYAPATRAVVHWPKPWRKSYFAERLGLFGCGTAGSWVLDYFGGRCGQRRRACFG